MAKKNREKPRREITKHQLAHWQQQKRRQHILFGVGIFIIAAVLIIVGVGWYTNQYQPLHQTVISVNGTRFNMDYYIKALKFYGKGQPTYYMYSLADDVVPVIEQNELVKQEAVELGISVNQDEVDKELKSLNPPLSKDYRDFVRAAMLVDKLRDDYFDKQVSVYTKQRHITVMLLESESQAIEIRTRLESGESFEALAGEFSLVSYSEEENSDMGWRPEGILTTLFGTSVVDDYAFSSEIGVLSQPLHDEEIFKGVGYWIVKVLDKESEPDKADVQIMLLGSEKEALEVRTKLEAGDDFATLAQEFSQHETKDNGGEVTGVTPDMMSLALSEFVFDPELELEAVSEPIFDDTAVTKGGYWLVKVVDEDDNRQIEDSDRDLLKSEAFTEWVKALRDDPENKVEDYLDGEMKAWAVERATRS